MKLKGNDILALFFVLMAVYFIIGIIPALEKNASDNFNKTFSALEQNINTILKHACVNMTENEKRGFINNSCDLVFNHSNYRGGDAELCKLKMKS